MMPKLRIVASDQTAIIRDRAGLRRQRIIASARKLFLQNGFHATGVAQIAKESGVAVGQIYRDFAGKEEIVAVIVRTDCANFLKYDSLLQNIESGDIEWIWAWLADFIGPGEEEVSDVLLAEIVAEASRNDRVAEIFESMGEEVFGAIQKVLGALAPGDHLAERRAWLARLAMAISLGLIQQRLLRPKDGNVETARLALAMIRAEVADMRRGAAALV